MPDFKPPQYPDILTVRSWEKNKGLWTKVVSQSTGLTDLLKDCESEYGNVHWDRFDFPYRLILESERSEQTLDQLRKDAEKDLPTLKKLAKALDLAESRAAEVHKEFKANKLVSKASAAHVKEVAEQAKSFGSEVSAQNIKKLLDEQYKLGVKVVEKDRADRVKSMANMHKFLDLSEAKIKSVKTREDYVTFHELCISGVAREFGNLFGVVPGLKDYHKEFLRTCAQNRMPHSDDDVEPQLSRIGPLLKNIRKKLEDHEAA